MNALNKTGVVLLTNKSGNLAIKGAVVGHSSGDPKAFTYVDWVGNANSMMGVVVEPNGIQPDAKGMVAFSGYVDQVNLDESANLGNTFCTSTTAFQGTPNSYPSVGDFGWVLTTGTTPSAILFGIPIQSIGGSNKYAKLEDQKPTGNNGGAATGGVWFARDLNTLYDPQGIVIDLSTNYFTLNPGTYQILASAPFYGFTTARIILSLAGFTGVYLTGTSEKVSNGARSWVSGEFSIVSPSAFSIGAYAVGAYAPNDGLGVANNDSKVEVYTMVEIWKIA